MIEISLLLDSIRIAGSNLIRQYAINRTINQAKASGFSDNIDVPVNFQVPIFGYTFSLKGNFAHSASKANTFEQTLIDYPLSSATMPADYRHKYLRDTPNHNTSYNFQSQWHLRTPTIFGEAYYGYATGSMNTDDVVWNARLTKSFNKAGIVLMLDGFDILGNLSNTTQVMNTQGRTETYRNALPRYVMFHFQYRLNVKPKKM